MAKSKKRLNYTVVKVLLGKNLADLCKTTGPHIRGLVQGLGKAFKLRPGELVVYVNTPHSRMRGLLCGDDGLTAIWIPPRDMDPGRDELGFAVSCLKDHAANDKITKELDKICV